MSSGKDKKNHKMVKIPKPKKKKKYVERVLDIDTARIREIRDLAEDIVDDSVYVMFRDLLEKPRIRAYLETDNVLD